MNFLHFVEYFSQSIKQAKEKCNGRKTVTKDLMTAF